MITDPVVGKEFYGRKEILNLLNKRADSLKEGYRQNIAILGEKFLGKTSVIHQFILSLEKNSVIPVYIEVRIEPFYNFANRFITTFLYHYLTTEKEEVPQDLNNLIKECEKLIPKTIERVSDIQDLLSKKKENEVYDSLLDLPSILRRESDKNFILILDEFQNLNKFNIKKAFSKLGQKIMLQRFTMYVVASSYYSKAKDIMRKRLSLLFGQFQIINVERFSDETAKEYLKEKLFPIKITNKYKQFLVNITSGHPFYLNIIGSNLSKIGKLEGAKRISLDHLTEVLSNSIFDSKGILTQYFSNSVSKLPLHKESVSILILLAIANGKNKTTQIKEYIGKEYATNLKKPLRLLQDLNFIDKNGRFYKFKDELLKFWLKYVYQSKYDSIHVNISQKKEYFKKRVKDYFTEYISLQERGINPRIISLFNLFCNDMVPVIGGKRRKLPDFDEVYEDKIGNSGPFIMAYTKGKVWVLAVKNDFVDQDDIQDFLKACKRSRRNIYRRIIIHINGIHVNAKILGKEKGLWLWDLNTLNHLLTVYGKEKVVK